MLVAVLVGLGVGVNVSVAVTDGLNVGVTFVTCVETLPSDVARLLQEDKRIKIQITMANFFISCLY